MQSEWFEKLKQSDDVYIIAEVGSNYLTHDDCIAAIRSAKKVGADAVKFQSFNRAELFGPYFHEPKVELRLEELAKACEYVGIDFLCSAFSPQGVAKVDPFVRAHKVASSEMQHIRILDAVKATGKPVILSTGGQVVHDVNRALEYLGDEYPIVLMHCNLKYPAKLVDLRKLEAFRGFKGPLGYSDHTTSIDAVPVLMRFCYNMSVIEKHFNPLGLIDTPDAPHSLNEKEFEVMVSYLRGEPLNYTEENEARLKHVRRVVAIKDLKAGDVLKEGETMGIYRSLQDDARGVTPFAIGQLEGKRLKSDISIGQGIHVTDAE